VGARRFGNESAETRLALLDLAEQMMCESGYASVTSRQLAKRAGLSPQIVYYYFKTMDDLFAELFLRSREHYLAGIERASQSDQPLVALWELSCDTSRAVVVQELMALANHRKGLLTLLSEFGRNYHRKQTEIIESELAAKGLDWGMPPAIIASIMEVAARGFASGRDYDIPAHREAQAFITSWLAKMDKASESNEAA
jgi:TetR/AcrR family transcriptional regulator